MKHHAMRILTVGLIGALAACADSERPYDSDIDYDDILAHPASVAGTEIGEAPSYVASGNSGDDTADGGAADASPVPPASSGNATPPPASGGSNPPPAATSSSAAPPPASTGAPPPPASSSAPASDPDEPKVPHAPLLHPGLHPAASDALRFVGISSSRITQTIGDFGPSAGTHNQDGSVDGKGYSAATDISVRGMSEAQIRTLLQAMANVGLAGWYRKPGNDGWVGAAHIHTIYVGCKMKGLLRAQVSDWLSGRNGLKSHTRYKFYSYDSSSMRLVKKKYAAHN